jgi:hypothetical protein
MSKYSALENYLSTKVTFTLSYEEIEKIIGDTLPQSAHEHRAWWANPTDDTHPHAKSWMNAGWKVSTVELGRTVTFIKYEK